MKSYRKELWFNVPSRRGFVNITPELENCLRESGVKEGLLLCIRDARHDGCSIKESEQVARGGDRIEQGHVFV